ncbi:MAG: glycosyltransferase family 4 protein [Armatimonadota bacterium]|nr:MAG: glycosyltransferase family 4 protein [Armatimonadota bacterium]
MSAAADDRRPRVLMVGPTPPPIGGIAAQVSLLLGSSLQSDFRIIHLDPAIPGGQGLPRRLVSSLGLIARFLAKVWSSRAQVVHVHSSSFGGFFEKGLLAVLAKVMGRKAVLHLHGGGLQQFWDRSRMKCLIAWILRTVDVVIVLSEAWKQRVARMSPSARLEVVPTSVPTQLYGPFPGGDREPVKILFVGWIDRNKGVFDLVDAIVGMAKRPPQFQVHMIGNGRDMNALKAMIADRGVQEFFTIYGWVTEDFKRRALRTASIFVLPSHVEGLPTALLEAMAAGLPVVATRVGAIPEAVAHGVHGELVEAKDPSGLRCALENLRQDSALRHRYGEAGRRRARCEYDTERSARRIGGVYHRLLAECRPIGPSGPPGERA